MDIGLQIKSLLSEAELYRSQGLYTDAREKYQDAADKIRGITRLRNKDQLLKNISSKIKVIDETTEKVSTGNTSPALSEKGQDLIKNLFGKDDLEQAIALVKFGQVERALADLGKLLKVDAQRVTAGKYILQCKLLIGTVDDAVEQYKRWHADGLFTAEQLTTIRTYLQSILQKEGIDDPLPLPANDGSQQELSPDTGGIDFSPAEPADEILDITAIGILMEKGPQQGKVVEFDVNFQSGQMLSLIISKTDKALIQDLNKGDRFSNVTFYSPIAIFNGGAVVANKTQITAGPKQGDYCLDLQVQSA